MEGFRQSLTAPEAEVTKPTTLLKPQPTLDGELPKDSATVQPSTGNLTGSGMPPGQDSSGDSVRLRRVAPVMELFRNEVCSSPFVKLPVLVIQIDSRQVSVRQLRTG